MSALWDPFAPELWAKKLGMVNVPLFGPTRAERHPGTHAVLLDGDRVSFTFSAVERADEAFRNEALAWAWSSNVTHAIISEREPRRLVVRRWDAPGADEIRTVPPSGGAVVKLIERLRDQRKPTAESAVAYALHLFRVLRKNVEKRGGVKPVAVVRAFNALMAWAATSPPGERMPPTLGEVADALAKKGFSFRASDFSDRLRAFEVAEFLAAVHAAPEGLPYRLDADLIIRHAAGRVYQEAHRELATKPADPQKRLFDADDFELEAGTDERFAPKDVHYTPEPFARALVLEAFRALGGAPEVVEVLDPACGSGVFLIEAARELSRQGVSRVRLNGFDISPAAREMADFSVDYVSRGLPSDVGVRHSIKATDSLREPWGRPNLILMNPPFASWEDMPEETRAATRRIIGDSAHGRTDLSAAFLRLAVQAIPVGGAVASVMPSSFLESASARPVRDAILDDPQLSVRLIGRITGFGYFSGADVEPAFVVIAREAVGRKARPRLVLSAERYADRALRRLRRTETVDVVEPVGRAQVDLGRDWTPRLSGTADLAKALRRRKVPKASDLFDIRLGIRTGDNKAFVLRASELHELPKVERKFFRPAAGTGTIRLGMLRAAEYVFYPYDRYGRPSLQSEDAVRQKVPTYYERFLKPRRDDLMARAGIDRAAWWLLTRARTTWLTEAEPRIVSAAFADVGSFAFDPEGIFAVVQGNAWLPKAGPFHDDAIPFAYVALLNSPAFIVLLSHFSRPVGGGQLEAYNRYIGNVPVPDLAEALDRTVNPLATMGRSIARGWFPGLDELDAAVATAYGVSVDDFVAARPIPMGADFAAAFARLARWWRRDTSHLSSPRQMVQHPAYQQIIRLGARALPYISEAMESDKRNWLPALEAIVGDTPPEVAAARGYQARVAAWGSWAKARGGQ